MEIKPEKYKPESQNIDWSRIKEDFVTKNLDSLREKPYSLKDVSEAWGIPYGTVRNHAAKERWRDALDEARTTWNITATEEVPERFVVNENEIRSRQHKIIKRMIEKVATKLKSLDPTSLTNKEAIALLRFCLREERVICGIPESITVSNLEPLKPGTPEGLTPSRADSLMDKVARIIEAKTNGST